MFKLSYYDEDSKSILNSEINTDKDFVKIVSKVFPGILPHKEDSEYVRIGKLIILLANFISIPYYGKEHGFDESKCSGYINSNMKLQIYTEGLLPIEMYDFKYILCQLYKVNDEDTISNIYRMYEAEVIDDLDTELVGKLLEQAFQYALLLDLDEDEEDKEEI
jgi:hypothetical protein|nr:MAG TPA: hypothetical protein [Caudoviricetes sp.]